MYTYFSTFAEGEAPSFVKFARSIGLTLAELNGYRVHSEFERAWQECNEIRRDYLIDNALCKRFDGSVTKFLLAAEYGMGERKEDSAEKSLDFTLRVVESGDE